MLDGIEINNNVDFNCNQALNLRVEILSEDPTVLVSGKLWFNSSDSSLRYYNGSQVVNLSTGFSVYTHTQGVASDTWSIEHNLNRHVQITIVDSGDNVVEGAESYDDLNNITIEFGAPFTGKAYLT
jgi:hypothetical protein